MTKTKYEPPMFRTHGKVEAVTKANTGGSTLDIAFQAGTPIGDLTTS
ncbi:MAG: putative RiPP precursor [Pseudomonadota bacterium]